ncbi:restriction endonuclease type II-like protein [Crepidotus variabilis]|uniref:Restriction endonuclease type II-like protein n=1 Tax=Crepidotus variabilis TaxID=179855 RepID=A0A9P6JQ95_9AGAR|nr:restriction endonuclease type II-like protein [Crepidotus variabilis]
MATSTTSSVAPPVVIPASGSNIIVSPLQRGNPVLDCIRNVGKEFGDIVADYQVGRTTGVLFLSLKYHRLHPEYILTRIEKLGISYNLRILLVLCDITEHREPIRELTKACLINNLTVIVAFSNEEAGHYLTTYKQFEFKSPDMIKERSEKDYHSILRSTLTTISKVNKTDVETLRMNFGSFAKIAKATPEQLQNLPGFGQVKVKNINNALDKPFRNQATSSITTSLSQQKQRELTQGTIQPTLHPSGSSTRRVRREESPTWDIELDDAPLLDDEDEMPPQSGKSKGKAKAIPQVFDIDLDLT